MGYFMRFILTGSRHVALAEIEAALKEVDDLYTLRHDESLSSGELYYGALYCGVMELTDSDEDLFEDEIESFLENVGPASDEVSTGVADILRKAQQILAVEAYWEGINAESVLSRIDPLWVWLHEHRQGIMQADGEGFYDATGLVLERRFTL